MSKDHLESPTSAGSGKAMPKGQARWQLHCTVNGAQVDVEVDPMLTAYDVLRDELRLTGTKGACLEGECGSCTILLDGKPVTSCLVLAPQLEGREVVTIEGLASDAVDLQGHGDFRHGAPPRLLG